MCYYSLLVAALLWGLNGLNTCAQTKLDAAKKAAVPVKSQQLGGKSQLPVVVASKPLEYDTVFTSKLPVLRPEVLELRHSAKKALVVSSELFYRLKTTDSVWIKPRLKHYSFLCRFTQSGNECADLFGQVISNECWLDTCNMDRRGNPEVWLTCALEAGGNGIRNAITTVHLLDVSHRVPLLLLSALLEDKTEGMGGIGGKYQERGCYRRLAFGRELRVGALKTSDEDGWNYFAKQAFGTIGAGRYRYRSGHLVQVGK